MSKCIIVVGGTGSGKTTFAKNEILKKHKGSKLIYDVNKEYTEFNTEYMQMDVFLQKALAAKNKLILFEEATIFFDTKGGSREMRELLVRKRHTNNMFVFNFHSLGQVPLYILNFVDYLILFKTTDQWSVVERKYKNNELIYDTFTEVQSNNNGHFHKMLKMR